MLFVVYLLSLFSVMTLADFVEDVIPNFFAMYLGYVEVLLYLKC